MSRIGKIQVDIVGNVAPFTKATEEAEKKGLSFSKAVKGAMSLSLTGLGNAAAGAARHILSIKTAVVAAAGAFGAYKIVGTLGQAAAEVDKIGKASQRLGISVPTLSALRFAAGEANVEFETLAKMAGKASRELAEMVSKGQAELKIGRVTVKLTDANGQLRGINELLPSIARGFETVGSQGEKLRLSEKIFGRAGGEAFVQFLEDSGGFMKNLGEQTARAARLNNIFTEAQAKSADELLDAAGRVKAAWLGIRVAIVTEVAPAVTKFLDGTAERLGELPFLIRSTWQAISNNAKDNTPGAQAFERLMKNSVEVVKVSAVEIGKVLGTTLVETIVIALQAAGPAIADVFRDNLGPILNVIPGVNIERSMRGKLAALRQNLNEAKAAQAQLLQAQLLNDRLRYLDSNQARFQAQSDLRRAEGAVATTGSVDHIAKQIALHERLVSNEDLERARALSNAFVTGFQAAGAQAQQMQEKISAALTKWDEAKEQIFDLAGKEGFVGPPAPTATKSADVLKRWGALGMLYQIPDLAKAIGAEAGKNFQKAWAGAMKSMGSSDALKDALKLAEEIQFQLYPEKKLQADIENVKRAKAVLDHYGRDHDLTGEDLDKYIEQLKKKFEKLQDKSDETFAGKLGRDIKGFSESASEAFADLVVDGEASFDQLLKSWTKTLVSMATQHFLFAPLFGQLGAGAGKLFTPTPVPSSYGNVITSGQIVPYAKGGLTGIINDTVIFPMRGGKLGSVAEGGRAEYAVEPVRMSDGNLGVRASGGGAVVQIFDQRQSGARPQVDQTTGSDGRQLVRVWIRDEINGMVQNGSLDRSFGSAFGGRRRPVGR